MYLNDIERYGGSVSKTFMVRKWKESIRRVTFSLASTVIIHLLSRGRCPLPSRIRSFLNHVLNRET